MFAMINLEDALSLLPNQWLTTSAVQFCTLCAYLLAPVPIQRSHAHLFGADTCCKSCSSREGVTSTTMSGLTLRISTSCTGTVRAKRLRPRSHTRRSCSKSGAGSFLNANTRTWRRLLPPSFLLLALNNTSHASGTGGRRSFMSRLECSTRVAAARVYSRSTAFTCPAISRVTLSHPSPPTRSSLSTCCAKRSRPGLSRSSISST